MSLPTYPLESIVVLRQRQREEEFPFVGEYLCEEECVWYGIGEMVLCCLCLIPKTEEEDEKDRANSISVSLSTQCSAAICWSRKVHKYFLIRVGKIIYMKGDCEN